MNTTDRLTARLISFTVCLIGALAVLALLYQVVNGYEVDASVKELVALVVGGLLTRMTTTHASGGDEPINANIVNPANEPVPVDPQAGHGDVNLILLAAIALGVIACVVKLY